MRAGFNDGTPSLFDVVQGVSAVASAGADPWTRAEVLVLWTFHTADRTLSLTPTVAGADTLGYPNGTDPFDQTEADSPYSGSLARSMAWASEEKG